MPLASEKSRYFDSLEEEELYYHWVHLTNVSHVPEWDDFSTFRDFVLAKGYRAGFKLCRRYGDQPFGPLNCRIAGHNGGYTLEELETIDRWNNTVNRIRAAHGLPLFETK